MAEPLHILITGGPTVEDIDPVRFLSNRSTGRMGVELAEAARRAGMLPRLILGPASIPIPGGVETIPVRSAGDMYRAVMDNLEWSDALVMAAAVADYTPDTPLPYKLKKTEGPLTVTFKRTRDILAAVSASPAREGKVVVGFSLDVNVNLDEGRRKLIAKNLDLIVVNTTSSFGSDRETAWLVTPSGEESCGSIGKTELAGRIVHRIEAMAKERH